LHTRTAKTARKRRPDIASSENPPTPGLAPPTIYQLRELWRRYRGNGVVQRLILEIQHLRGFLHDVEPLRAVIERCRYEETGNKLVALQSLLSELQQEFFRGGVITDAPMKPRPLPPFTPPSIHDLRALAQHYHGNEDIQTLIAEIRHARAFVLRIEELRVVIERCWRAETDCDLAALEELRLRLEAEKKRAGIIVSAAPAQREQHGLTARIPLRQVWSSAYACPQRVTGWAAPRRAFRPASSHRHRSADRPLPA
jgi:hypothetical protein